MGVWRPVSRSVGYVYFPPRVSRALGGRVRRAPSPFPASPPSWSRSAVWERRFRRHLRNKSDTLLTASYGEAGGRGITREEWYW